MNLAQACLRTKVFFIFSIIKRLISVSSIIFGLGCNTKCKDFTKGEKLTVFLFRDRTFIFEVFEYLLNVNSSSAIKIIVMFIDKSLNQYNQFSNNSPYHCETITLTAQDWESISSSDKCEQLVIEVTTSKSYYFVLL